MNPLLKVLFYLLAGANGYIFITGCAAVLGLVAWAYHLAIVQGKTGTGFGLVGLSYLAWVVFLVIGPYFTKGTWQ